MQPFEIGQKVICIDSDNWEALSDPKDNHGPKIDEITTISGFQEDELGLFLEFEEYPEIGADGQHAAYHSIYFRPIDEFIDNEELQEMLDECNLVHA